MFTRKILRDPNADGGGAAPAVVAPATPAAPAQTPAPSPSPANPGGHIGPTSYGGSSMAQLWQDPNDPKYQTQPQPPAAPGGNKTPAAPAVGEGGSQGQPAQGGNTPATNTNSTAVDANGQPIPEVKGILSPDDKAYWTKKDPVFADMPDHPAVAKMSGQYRELETKFNQGQQYLGVVNQTIEDYKAVLQSGDPAEIAKMVEHFGGEVQFDTRKAEDITKEIQGNYQDVLAVFKSLEGKVSQETISAINQGLEMYANQLNGKVGALTEKQTRREEIRKEVEKLTGVQTPKIGNPNERYQAPAKANMTTLEREFNDPNFWEYYNEIKGAFAPGGMFHAQGVTAGKAFGASIESARYYMDLAKGRWLAKNMESKVLPAHEQSWLKKQQGNSAAGAPPKGAGPANAGAPQDPSLSAMEARMAEHMKRHS